MLYLVILAGLIVAFLAAAGFTPLVRRTAFALGWVDAPDGDRKVHTDAMPVAGGLAIFGAVVVGIAFIALLQPLLPFVAVLPSPQLCLGAFLIVASGFYDDTRGLGFKGKFAVQVVVAYLLLHAGYRIDVTALPLLAEADGYTQALYAVPLTMLWVVGIINAVNLLDGLDGLAAGVVMIAIAALSLAFGLNGEVGLVLLGVVACGAIAGFLIYNFNPASIFMGDTGSLFLGYVVAAFTLLGKGNVDPVLALVVPVVALGLPIGDTFLSIFRRATERRAIFAPDRDHIHHRLAKRGTHKSAVLTMYGMAGFFGVTSVALSVATPLLGWGILVVTLTCCAVVIGRLGYLPERRRHMVATSGTVQTSELPPVVDHRTADSGAEDLRAGKALSSGDGMSGDGTSVLNLRIATPSAN